MLLTDNDYPRFYGFRYATEQQAMYLVAHRGAHPVFKFGNMPDVPPEMCMSSVHSTEAHLVRTIRGSSSADRMGRVQVSPKLAEAMLAAYREQRF
jgi:hypothetical protein